MIDRLQALYKAKDGIPTIDFCIEYKDAYYFEDFDKKDGLFILKNDGDIKDFKEFCEDLSIEDFEEYTNDNLCGIYEIFDGNKFAIPGTDHLC